MEARYAHGHRRGQGLQALARAAGGGVVHALDECHGVGERNRARPRAVQVTAHRPRPLVVIGVRRQTAGEVDAPAIEEVTVRRHGDEHRRVAVLGNADGRWMLNSCFGHLLLLRP